MKEGGVEQIYLAAVLLFGINPQKPIRIDDDIIFKITLVKVRDK